MPSLDEGSFLLMPTSMPHSGIEYNRKVVGQLDMLLTNIPVIILGFPMETLAGVVAFRSIWAVYIHSNVRLPIGPLRWFIGAPELHHWHHDRNQHAGNYANPSPLMDILFGTYTCPDHEPEAFGIEEQTSDNYVGQILIDPFKPERQPTRDDSVLGGGALTALLAGPERDRIAALPALAPTAHGPRDPLRQRQ